MRQETGYKAEDKWLGMDGDSSLMFSGWPRASTPIQFHQTSVDGYCPSHMPHLTLIVPQVLLAGCPDHQHQHSTAGLIQHPVLVAQG